MRKKIQLYSIFNKVSSVFMILALLWLTLCTPVVYAAQQNQADWDRMEQMADLPSSEEDAGNPLGNNAEEKAPSGNSMSEEYLHDHPGHACFFTTVLQHFGKGNDGTYQAFHGELLVPPPNQV